MPRAKSGPSGAKRHRKVLSRAKGYRGGRGKLYRTAVHAVQKGLAYAYVGRKQKKANFRSLWIVRIGAASRTHGLSYNRFLHGLKLAEVKLNRKVLANLAVHDDEGFKGLVDVARKALDSGVEVPAEEVAAAE